MFQDLKQFVLPKVCLACDGCCRFRQEKTIWQPRIAEEEKAPAAKPAAAKTVFPKDAVDKDGRIATVPYQELFICRFLDPRHNACGIYHARPFECRLYPFLLIKEKGFISVAAHLLCPFLEQNKDSADFETHVRYLKGFFGRGEVRAFLRRNPSLAGDYGMGTEEMEYLFSVIPEGGREGKEA